MAVEGRHVAGSLRLLDDTDATIHSYHRIAPDVGAVGLESFVQGVGIIRGELVGNALLTLTTELVDTDA